MTPLKITTFGSKYHGMKPPHRPGILWFGVLHMPNPYSITKLRMLTGLDTRVQDYLLDHAEVRRDLDQMVAKIEAQDPTEVCIFCYGGKHRSVAVAELLAKFLRTMRGREVEVHHLSLAQTSQT